MNIAYFWTWDFSKNILQSLLSFDDINIKLVVSQPDKPVWRKKEIRHTKVKELCLQKNLEIMQPQTLKDNNDFFEKLQSLNLDFIVVVAYWKIIPKEILDIPKYFCVNLHWSLLPLYRWASPIQESIKNWDKKTWITIMKMSEWMDEWDILKVEEVDIDIMDKTQDIFKKFEDIWPKLLYDSLNGVLKGKIIFQKQDEKKATYCKKIEKQDWKIDFEKETVIEIYNKYRAYHIWPWIFTFFKGKKLDIIDCFFEKNNLIFDKDFNLWDVVEFEDHNKKQVWILCKWWILILKKIKLEWKKEMDIFDFINWNKDFLDYNFNF